MMPKRVTMLETLRKDRPRQSRQTLYAPSLTRLPAPHPTPPRNPTATAMKEHPLNLFLVAG